MRSACRFMIPRGHGAPGAQGAARGGGALFAALCLAAALAVAACLPDRALAEVRKADVVAGKTVDERGLTVAQCPSIDCDYAVLVNAQGDVYFERDGSDASQIASITKVMTAIVALDNAAEGTHVAVSEAAASIGESSANLQQGDVMDLETALKALLVPSGNDAAQAIAETVGAQMIAADPGRGNDPVQVFVAAMNDKAAELGCADTWYENPHGLDDGAYEGSLHSTALDQAKVAQCAMTYPLIRDIVSGGDTVITVTRGAGTAQVELETTDGLFDIYDFAIGIKTGMTDLAGPSFMGAASRNGRELYAVVLGSADTTQRFYDARELFEWAYEHVVQLPLANSDEYATARGGGLSGEVPVIAEVSHADWTDRTVPATLADPSATVEVFDMEGNVSQAVEMRDLHGTVRAGDVVGHVVFKQRNQVVAEQDLVACETVEAPNPIDAVAIWWSRLVGGFNGTPAQAESKIYNVMPVIDNHMSNAA